MKETLTTTEAAKMLGFHVNTLKNWVRDGKMPAFKTLGGHYRIRAKDLVRVLKENGIPVPPQLEPRYVLLTLDEDAAFQAQLKGLFEARPGMFEVKPFLNGFDALVEIGRKAPDIILISLRLTHMDGLHLLAKLKSNPTTSALKIIAVSHRPDDSETAKSAGAFDFFLKSDGLPVLIEKIKNAANDKFLEFPAL